MENQDTFGIHFGALAPTISKQLKEQKLKFSEEKAKEFETSRQAVIQLMFAGILNDSQTQKAYDKLFTKIKQHIKSKNNGR